MVIAPFELHLERGPGEKLLRLFLAHLADVGNDHRSTLVDEKRHHDEVHERRAEDKDAHGHENRYAE